MRSLKGFAHTSCVLRCSPDAEDSLEHYCRCRLLRTALAAHTTFPADSIDDFFAVRKGMTTHERIECARRIRVTCQVVRRARGGGYELTQRTITELVDTEWQNT